MTIVGQAALSAADKGAVQRFAGIELRGQQKIMVPVVQKVSDRARGVGGESLQFRSGPIVQRSHGGLRKSVAHFSDRASDFTTEGDRAVRHA